MIRPQSRCCRAFTLIEMLVVIGMLATLLAVLGVVVSKARGTADKFRIGAQLQAIQLGLDAYKTDFQAYPSTTVADAALGNGDDDINADGFRGARTLCKALMGQCPASSNTPRSTSNLAMPSQDGKDGFGFTIVGRSGVATIANTTTGELSGKTYGPYLNVDKFKVVNVSTSDSYVYSGKTYNMGDPIDGNAYDDRAVLLDANDSPILYYPCLNPQAPASTPSFATASPKPAAFAYVGIGHTTNSIPSTVTASVETNATGATTYPQRVAITPTLGVPMYDAMDNGRWLTGPVFRQLMGDTGDSSGAGVADGEIDLSLGEKPAVVGKYILWSAGPDKIFGPNQKNGTVTVGQGMKQGYDDVTNFQGE